MWHQGTLEGPPKASQQLHRAEHLVVSVQGLTCIWKGLGVCGALFCLCSSPVHTVLGYSLRPGAQRRRARRPHSSTGVPPFILLPICPCILTHCGGVSSPQGTLVPASPCRPLPQPVSALCREFMTCVDRRAENERRVLLSVKGWLGPSLRNWCIFLGFYK